MQIYSAEKDLGLEAKILASRSIAYTSPIREEDGNNPGLTDIFDIAKSSLKSQSGKNDEDLYYTKSILVTSNWNKNDDVFDKGEVWAARNTPKHKPTNLEHDEHILVGHITENWVIDEDGKILAENTEIEDLPNVFHIVNGAVIYTNWEDKDLVERTDNLITAIKAGKKFVSMECLFSSFDYAVITPEGKSHVVARQEDSAWLTKHLRAYGGTGEYQGNRIGRLLRGIMFSGKGYVDNPANPESIIFNDSNVFNFSIASSENPFIDGNGVIYITEEGHTSANQDNKEKNRMSDILKEQISELKTKVTEFETRAKKAEEDLVKADVDKLQAENDELLKQRNIQVEDNDKLTKQVAELTEKAEKLEKDGVDLAEAKAELEKQLDEVKAAELRTDRISNLVDGGIEKESAEAKVDKFVNLNDEQFGEIAEELIKAVKAQANVTVDKDEETTDEETGETEASDEETDTADNVDEETLDSAEANKDVSLSTEGISTEESELEVQRKELQEGIASRLGHTVANDEEEDSE